MWLIIVEITKLVLSFFSDDRRKLLVCWTLSQWKVVQSLALYCAARLLIGGNYWYAGLSVCGKLSSR